MANLLEGYYSGVKPSVDPYVNYYAEYRFGHTGRSDERIITRTFVIKEEDQQTVLDLLYGADVSFEHYQREEDALADKLANNIAQRMVDHFRIFSEHRHTVGEATEFISDLDSEMEEFRSNEGIELSAARESFDSLEADIMDRFRDFVDRYPDLEPLMSEGY